jgi:mannose-6-phosphate isomerase-like protein (cupin superfamily)
MTKPTITSDNPVWEQNASVEFLLPERCHIIETFNSAADASLSIARARVEPGVTTAWHAVEGTIERSIIADGHARVEIGDCPARDVGPGDVVVIPAGIRQRITNTGERDLIFYCVCTPRFQSINYRALE